jgi:release factor glutamine methyltransferase
LDAELILAHATGRNRTWLVAHEDFELPADIVAQADNLAFQRSKNVPLAYLTGHKEFFGLDFWVTPDVLIPRPETEVLVEAALRIAHPKARILDVGTGSGAIAVALAKNIPEATITASDISPEALKIAARNARTNHVDVQLVQSDLLDQITGQFGIIAANLPYVARDWEVSPDTKHEPDLALYANDSGLELIKRLVLTAPKNLPSQGTLCLEMDQRQINNISEFAVQTGRFKVAETAPFLLVLQRCD